MKSLISQVLVYVSVLIFGTWNLSYSYAALDSLSLEGVTSVDVANQAASIPLRWQTSEVVEYITVTFRQDPPEGLGVLSGGIFTNGTSGSIRIEIPRYAKPGIWRIDSIFLALPDGRSFQYDRVPRPYSDFLPIPLGIENLAISVSNNSRDDVPPVVESFQVEIEKMRRDPIGKFYAPCKIIVRDNLSGFDTAEVFFQQESPSQNGVVALLNRADFIHGVGGVINDGHRGVYSGRLSFTHDDPIPGSIYTFSTARIQDLAGNAEFVSAKMPNSYSLRGWRIDAVAAEGTPFEGLYFQIPSTLENIPQDPPYSRENYGLAGVGNSGGPAAEKPKKKSGKSKSSSANKSGGSKKKSEAKRSGGKKIFDSKKSTGMEKKDKR
jgi:hypothetical protein